MKETNINMNTKLLNYLSEKNMEVLEKTEKTVTDSKGNQSYIPLVGDLDNQINIKEIDEFFSPIASAVLDMLDNDIFDIQILRAYLLVRTRDSIFKFTHYKDTVTVNAVTRHNNDKFYFADSRSKNCILAMRRTISKLKGQY